MYVVSFSDGSMHSTYGDEINFSLCTYDCDENKNKIWDDQSDAGDFWYKGFWYIQALAFFLNKPCIYNLVDRITVLATCR